jgi:DNA-binding transcriptional MerR regulator
MSPSEGMPPNPADDDAPISRNQMAFAFDPDLALSSVRARAEALAPDHTDTDTDAGAEQSEPPIFDTAESGPADQAFDALDAVELESIEELEPLESPEPLGESEGELPGPGAGLLSPTEDARAETVDDPRIPPGKLFFKIGEVAKITGVKPYVLRYWETEFPWLRPSKTSTRQRLYRRQDVALLFQIKRLRYEEHETIAGAKQHIKRYRGQEKDPRSREPPRRLPPAPRGPVGREPVLREAGRAAVPGLPAPAGIPGQAVGPPIAAVGAGPAAGVGALRQGLAPGPGADPRLALATAASSAKVTRLLREMRAAVRGLRDAVERYPDSGPLLPVPGKAAGGRDK